MSTGITTLSSIGGPRRGAATLNQGTTQGRLITALDNILYAEPPELFASRYLLVNERAMGGQAVVQVHRSHLSLERCRSLHMQWFGSMQACITPWVRAR